MRPAYDLFGPLQHYGLLVNVALVTRDSQRRNVLYCYNFHPEKELALTTPLGCLNKQISRCILCLIVVVYFLLLTEPLVTMGVLHSIMASEYP